MEDIGSPPIDDMEGDVDGDGDALGDQEDEDDDDDNDDDDQEETQDQRPESPKLLQSQPEQTRAQTTYPMDNYIQTGQQTQLHMCSQMKSRPLVLRRRHRYRRYQHYARLSVPKRSQHLSMTLSQQWQPHKPPR
jgi:hypothetical protein